MKPYVLVIDDEESIRFTFTTFLRDEGYDAEAAASFEDAIEAVASREPDVIFADIILGRHSGMDFLKEVKQLPLKCPIVMITGSPSIETASEAVRLGAFDYIAKPVKRDTLLRVAAVALRHKAVMDERERYRSNLEAVFMSVKDAIVTVDAEMLLMEANGHAGELCGVGPESAGMPYMQLASGCSGACVDALRRTLAENSTVELQGVRCRHSRPSGRQVNITTAPLRHPDGTHMGAVLVVRDESRIMELERSLAQRRGMHGLVGQSSAMQKLYGLIEDLCGVDSTVLIQGASGTGKELVADALHYGGTRASGPLVKVNCSALPDTLLESELFGHVRGAFTGAVASKDGRFLMAHGGTIFLDEIGDMSQAMQLRLLRVLQDKSFERIGDTRTVKADVRVVAATNSDLRARVARGAFREDLYYRLNVVRIDMPLLKDRRADIPLLARHFVHKHAVAMHKAVGGVSDEVLRLLVALDWPGNVRQLEHALEYSVIRTRGREVALDDLPPDLFESEGPQDEPTSAEEAEAERARILDALEKSGGNKAKAARMLGVSRQTLYRKLLRYNID